jgi:DNA invertase Pin-like site-specific DNA recombinase
MSQDCSAPLSVSERTRAALAEAKARGVVLGRAGTRNLQATLEKRTASADAFARLQQPVFAEFQALGLTHREMAAELNRRGIAAARGGEWTHGQVQRMLNRLTP